MSYDDTSIEQFFVLFFFTHYVITRISSRIPLYCIVIDQIDKLPENGLKSWPETSHYIENTWISRKIKIKLYFSCTLLQYALINGIITYSCQVFRVLIQFISAAVRTDQWYKNCSWWWMIEYVHLLLLWMNFHNFLYNHQSFLLNIQDLHN